MRAERQLLRHFYCNRLWYSEMLGQCERCCTATLVHEELAQPVLAIGRDQRTRLVLRSLESLGHRLENRCHGVRERSEWLGRVWLVPMNSYTKVRGWVAPEAHHRCKGCATAGNSEKPMQNQ